MKKVLKIVVGGFLILVLGIVALMFIYDKAVKDNYNKYTELVESLEDDFEFSYNHEIGDIYVQAKRDFDIAEKLPLETLEELRELKSAYTGDDYEITVIGTSSMFDLQAMINKEGELTDFRDIYK